MWNINTLEPSEYFVKEDVIASFETFNRWNIDSKKVKGFSDAITYLDAIYPNWQNEVELKSLYDDFLQKFKELDTKKQEELDINQNLRRLLSIDVEDSMNNDIFVLNLKDFGFEKDEFLDLVKKSLFIDDLSNKNELQKHIKDYQKLHWLEIDGKIWKQTFMEMFSLSLIDDVDKAIKTKKRDLKLENDLLFAISNPVCSERTMFILLLKTNEYNNIFWETLLNSKINNSINEWAQVFQQNENFQKALNTKWKKGKTLYEDIKDKWFFQGMSNHSKEIKVVVLVAFIFWIIPWLEKLPWVSTWYWRIALLIWGVYLWLDKWLDDLLAKWWELAEDWTEVVSNWYKEVKKWVEAWYKKSKESDYIDKLTENLWKTTWEVKTKFTEWYNDALSTIKSSNDKNKDVKDKYIIDLPFVSDKVNNDPKIMNKKISELYNIKSDKSTLLWLLSNPNDFFPTNLTREQKTQRENDLVHYIDLLLSKDGKSLDVYVKDLVYPKSIFSDLINKVSETNIGYTKDKKSDDKIKKLVSGFEEDKTKSEVIIYIMNSGSIEEWNDKDNIKKLKKYLENNKLIIEDDKNIIKSIIEIFEKEAFLYDSLEKISNIQLANEKVEADTITSIHTKVQTLESIKEDFDENSKRSEDFDNISFTKKYDDKKLELYKKWAELEWVEWGIYSTWFNSLELNSKLSKDEEDIKNIEDKLSDLPTENSKPKEFATFYENNYDNIKKIDILLDKYLSTETEREKDIYKKLDSINAKFEKVKENYEKVKENYKTKVDEIKKKIDDITFEWNIDKSELEKHKKTLQLLLIEFETIKSESIQSYTIIDNINTLWDKYVKKEMVITKTDNLFEKVDNKILSNTERPDLESIVSKIESKIIDLDSKFEIKIDITNLDITNSDDVSKVVNEIVDRKKVIDDMVSIDIKNKKETDLKTIVSELVKKYEEAITNESDLTKMAQIKSQYERLVHDKLNWLIVGENKVENAYEKQLGIIERNKFMKKTVSDEVVREILNKSKIEDFFNKYQKNTKLKNIDKTMWDNTPLFKILEVFKSIANSKIGYSEEIKDEAKVIYNDLNHHIDIAVKWLVKTYLDKLVKLKLL